MMAQIAKFENNELNVNIETIKIGDNIWFKGKDVAIALEYKNNRRTLTLHVDDDYKRTLGQLQGVPDSGLPLKQGSCVSTLPLKQGSTKSGLPSKQGSTNMVLPSEQGSSRTLPPNQNELNTIYINEPGLYQLIFSSKMKEAKLFAKWVFEDVLPSIRKSGKYEAKQKIVSPQIQILNETNLHYKVIEFIKKFYPSAILIAGLGEHQTTIQKRTDAFYKGYTGGQPDILILNHHKQFDGFAIELKTPTGKGKVSDKQNVFLSNLKSNNYKCLISNDYDEIIVELIEYFRELRTKCNLCNRWFKTSESLKSHLIGFHKVKQEISVELLK